MLRVVPGLLSAGLLLSSDPAYAERAARKVPPPKAQPSSLAVPQVAPVAQENPAPVAPAPSASAAPSAPTTQKNAQATPPGEAAPTADSASGPAAPAAAPSVRVYMRSGTDPLLFSARARNNDGTPTLCSAPCDARFSPGEYQLRLNGVVVDGPVRLARPGTLHGKFESREASREGGWLALNVGGILGGVFITVAALGGPSWAYVAGGGSLLSGGVIFVLTYRADRASVSFTPGDPLDVRGLPPPVPTQNNSSGPTPDTSLERPGSGVAAQARGLGFRIAF